jgi:polar amino acid transport system substrate-binding protein
MRIALVLLALAAPPAGALELLTEQNPPFNYLANGVAAGPSTEIVGEMARRAGIQPKIALGPWQPAFERARDGDGACVFSTARTPQRVHAFQWVGPIARGEYTAFSRAGFQGQPKRVDDLKSYRIGVVNDARAEYLRSRGFTNLVTFTDDREIPKQIGNSVDLWVTQALRAESTAASVGVEDLKAVFRAILVQDYWLACGRKVPAGTIAKLNEALAGMMKDGTVRRILRAGVF